MCSAARQMRCPLLTGQRSHEHPWKCWQKDAKQCRLSSASLCHHHHHLHDADYDNHADDDDDDDDEDEDDEDVGGDDDGDEDNGDDGGGDCDDSGQRTEEGYQVPETRHWYEGGSGLPSAGIQALVCSDQLVETRCRKPGTGWSP